MQRLFLILISLSPLVTGYGQSYTRVEFNTQEKNALESIYCKLRDLGPYQLVKDRYENFSYDSAGNKTLMTSYYYDWEDSIATLRAETKEEYGYDSLGLLRSVIFYDNQSNNSIDWNLDRKQEYQYDPAGHITSFYSYRWDNDSLNWIDDESETKLYEYDGEGRMISYTYYTEWCFFTCELDTYRCEYAYDTAGRRISESRYLWDGDTSSWIPTEKNETLYSGNGKKHSDLLFLYEDGAWRASEKTEYEYYNNGNLLRSTIFCQRDETWVAENKNEYEYNAEGNLLRATEFWKKNEQWFAGGKNEYSYDSFGNCIQHTEYHRPGWGGNDQWIVQKKTEYQYNPDHHLKKKTEYDWKQINYQLMPMEQQLFTYNESGKMVSNTFCFQRVSAPGTEYWKDTTLYTIDYYPDGRKKSEYEDGELKKEFFYGDSGKVTVFNYYWNVLGLVLGMKEDFIYNEKGLLVEWIPIYWDRDQEAWIYKNYSEYEYDDNRNLITQYEYRWDEGENNWRLSYRREYSYDQFGNLTEDIGSNLDLDGKWKYQQKTEHQYTYDDSGRMLTWIRLDWHQYNSEWDPPGGDRQFKSEYIYDASGTKEQLIHYIPMENSDGWDPVLKCLYSFEKKLDYNDLILPEPYIELIMKSYLSSREHLYFFCESLLLDRLPYAIKSLLIEEHDGASGWYDYASIDFSYSSANITYIQEPLNGIVRIFPIPARDLLTIDSNNAGQHILIVTSINGQQMFRMNYEGTSKTIDLSSLQKGVYIITIRSEDFVTARKIIKL